jgi:uncharacterized membrane protein
VAFEIISAQAALLILIVIALIGGAAIIKLTKNKTTNISNLRLFIQIVAVGVVFMGLLIGPFGTTQYMPLG